MSIKVSLFSFLSLFFVTFANSCPSGENIKRYDYIAASSAGSSLDALIGFRIVQGDNGKEYRFGNPIIPLTADVMESLKTAQQAGTPTCVTGTLNDRKMFALKVEAE